jgi:hypothetical protein
MGWKCKHSEKQNHWGWKFIEIYWFILYRCKKLWKNAKNNIFLLMYIMTLMCIKEFWLNIISRWTM